MNPAHAQFPRGARPSGRRAGICLTVVLVLLLGESATMAAEPPDYFQKLITSGNLEFEFYNPRTNPRRYPGWTQFLFEVRHDHQFRYDTTRQGTMVDMLIRPTIKWVDVRLSHKMLLPEYLDTDRRWGHSLVKHEFDHVAITVDPRTKMLTNELLHRIGNLTHSVSAATPIDDALVEQVINEELAKRRDALIGLIQANQYLLDKVTNHGNRRIPDREAFFKQLYTQPNLEQAKFPYIEDVSALLGRTSYRTAQLPYAW